MQDCIMSCVAEVSNITIHFVQPFKKHNHACLCLLCADPPNPNRSSNPRANAMLSLLPVATATDLDLISTGSNTIRQIIVCHEKLEQTTEQFLLNLKTHLGYCINFNFVDLKSQPYHVLCFMLLTMPDFRHLVHFLTTVKETRIVILAHAKMKTQVQATFFGRKHTTYIWFENQDLNAKIIKRAFFFKKKIQKKERKKQLTFVIAYTKKNMEGKDKTADENLPLNGSTSSDVTLTVSHNCLSKPTSASTTSTIGDKDSTSSDVADVRADKQLSETKETGSTSPDVADVGSDKQLSETEEGGLTSSVAFTTIPTPTVVAASNQCKPQESGSRPCVVMRGQSGLGNSLFQLAVASYYAELHSAKLLVVRTPATQWGTAKFKGRNQIMVDEKGEITSYEHTIFSKLTFVDADKQPVASCVFKSYHGDKHISWDTKKHPCLLIGSYQQNTKMFSITTAAKYLNYSDPKIQTYLCEKYKMTPQFIQGCVVIGLRRGRDFSGKEKISNSSINRAKRLHFPNLHALIVTDCGANAIEKTRDGVKFDFEYTLIDEKDITQFTLASMCPNMILSESTFHAWMAYMMQVSFPQTCKVVCFNKTELVDFRITQPTWIRMDYIY